MRRRTAAVLYAHLLFGESIARLLEPDRGLRLVRIDVGCADAHEQIERVRPNVVIVEGGIGTPGLLGLIRQLPEAVVVCVELEGNTAGVYRHWHIATATPEVLREVVHGRKPPAPDHAPLASD